MKTFSHSNRLSFIAIIKVLFVLATITLLISSCKKTFIQPRHIYDKNYFFILNMNGKSYNNYSWYYAPSPMVSDTPNIWGIYSNMGSSTGVSPWSLTVRVNAERVNLTYPVTSTCSANFTLTKTGDMLGAYSVSAATDHIFSDVEGKTYSIDPGDAVFNITYFSAPGTTIPVVEGNFQCTCHDINTSEFFPANGNFRLRAR